MKNVDIEFNISDDGRIVTRRIPGEVPGEIHDTLEKSLAELDRTLGVVTNRSSINPAFQKTAHLQKKIDLGHGHSHGSHDHHHH